MAKKKEGEVEPMDPPVTTPAEPIVEPEPAPEPEPAHEPAPAPKATAVQRQVVKQVTGMTTAELVARVQQLESVVQNVATQAYENERLNAMTDVIERFPDLWDAEKKQFLFDTRDKNPEEIAKAAEQANALMERGKVKVLSEYEGQFAQLRGMRPAPMTAESLQEQYDAAKAKRDTGMMQAILEAKPDGVRIAL